MHVCVPDFDWTIRLLHATILNLNCSFIDGSNNQPHRTNVYVSMQKRKCVVQCALYIFINCNWSSSAADIEWAAGCCCSSHRRIFAAKWATSTKKSFLFSYFLFLVSPSHIDNLRCCCGCCLRTRIHRGSSSNSTQYSTSVLISIEKMKIGICSLWRPCVSCASSSHDDTRVQPVRALKSEHNRFYFNLLFVIFSMNRVSISILMAAVCVLAQKNTIISTINDNKMFIMLPLPLPPLEWFTMEIIALSDSLTERSTLSAPARVCAVHSEIERVCVSVDVDTFEIFF